MMIPWMCRLCRFFVPITALPHLPARAPPSWRWEVGRYCRIFPFRPLAHVHASLCRGAAFAHIRRKKA